MREIKLQNIDICQQMLVLVKDLYFNSFPPEERRSWESVKQLLQADSTAYDLKVVLLNDKFAGFITSWIFGDFCSDTKVTRSGERNTPKNQRKEKTT